MTDTGADNLEEGLSQLDGVQPGDELAGEGGNAGGLGAKGAQDHVSVTGLE